jgi:hypothetical protein
MVEIKKENKIDKSSWPNGPWKTEPDYVEFEHKGFVCRIIRVDHSGHLCGYVDVPHTHTKVQSFDYFAIPLECHGGLTYGNHNEEKGIFTVGFDCAHYTDYCPKQSSYSGMMEMGSSSGQYRDINFVTNEIKSLVDQLLKD